MRIAVAKTLNAPFFVGALWGERPGGRGIRPKRKASLDTHCASWSPSGPPSLLSPGIFVLVRLLQKASPESMPCAMFHVYVALYAQTDKLRCMCTWHYMVGLCHVW